VGPENLRFGGGVTETALNPLVALVILVAGILICTLPRRHAAIPFLATAILIPTDQVLLLGGLHLPMLRILILFGLLRVAWLRTGSANWRILGGGINRIDIVFASLAVVIALNRVLLYSESQALINGLGELYSTLGAYFVFRCMIRGKEDVDQAIRVLAYVAAFVAVIMSYEHISGWNPYALLGGARSHAYASIMQRGDSYRASGCFAHPILAGAFGASTLPLFIGLWWRGRSNRVAAVLGILAATVMVVASNSSTPVLAYVAGILGLLFWPLRRKMRPIRWAIVLFLITLHLAMKAPVWHLISRVDVVGGSSSYHRYRLIDQFIRHFKDWWLIGTSTNADWGWSMWDTANQYVELGENSGLLPLVLFLAVIVLAFKYTGTAWRRYAGDRKKALFFWSLSAAVLANVVAYLGVSYFDQTVIAWYALLAMIPVAARGMPAQAVFTSQSEGLAESDLLSQHLASGELSTGSGELLFPDREEVTEPNGSLF
jgi:hypothetical protein